MRTTSPSALQRAAFSTARKHLSNENNIRIAKEIRDSLGVTLRGRVAEEIFFNHLSTGASNDLRKVARLAFMYVAAFSPGPGVFLARHCEHPNHEAIWK
ncbi:unnamed protein product [Phytomonas sp. EM1]|nr:unnamed protein product [Phytomonas sp. EM1]|eukprot:CCW65406.1 unnamed protein product [Phytomonas sp. isolate EM1]